MKYFFNIYDGTDRFDPTGTKCSGIREVRLHMLNMAMQEVMSADPQKGVWSIEAIDDRGVIVGSMDFGLLSASDKRF